MPVIQRMGSTNNDPVSAARAAFPAACVLRRKEKDATPSGSSGMVMTFREVTSSVRHLRQRNFGPCVPLSLVILAAESSAATVFCHPAAASTHNGQRRHVHTNTVDN